MIRQRVNVNLMEWWPVTEMTSPIVWVYWNVSSYGTLNKQFYFFIMYYTHELLSLVN